MMLSKKLLPSGVIERTHVFTVAGARSRSQEASHPTRCFQSYVFPARVLLFFKEIGNCGQETFALQEG